MNYHHQHAATSSVYAGYGYNYVTPPITNPSLIVPVAPYGVAAAAGFQTNMHLVGAVDDTDRYDPEANQEKSGSAASSSHQVVSNPKDRFDMKGNASNNFNLNNVLAHNIVSSTYYKNLR